MAIKRNGTEGKYSLLHNGVMLKNGYHNGTTQIWSAGNIVAYIADGQTYTEEVMVGESVLSPTTFTPTKSGATFLGWSASSTSATVLTDKVMGDEPITLYAVFKYNNVTIPSISKSHPDKFLPESQAIYAKSTLYSSVDLSKFGSATLNFSGVSIKQNFSWSTLNLVAICGGASVTLFTSKKDADTLTETAKSGTKTLTFTNTSGTYAMTAEVTGNGQGNSCYYTISGTLVGRTVVG